jgi:hypothetical protein
LRTAQAFVADVTGHATPVEVDAQLDGARSVLTAFVTSSLTTSSASSSVSVANTSPKRFLTTRRAPPAALAPGGRHTATLWSTASRGVTGGNVSAGDMAPLSSREAAVPTTSLP